MKLKIYVDLDGVLADFNGAACKRFQTPYPQKSIIPFNWIVEQLGITTDEFFEKLEKSPDFWSNMQTMPWTAEMIQILDSVCPDWHILTSATYDPSSWSGKAEWVKKYFGTKGLKRLIVVQGNKQRLATRDAILIDDRTTWCRNWIDAGGLGVFHWIEYTTDHTELWQYQLTRLRKFLESEAANFPK